MTECEHRDSTGIEITDDSNFPHMDPDGGVMSHVVFPYDMACTLITRCKAAIACIDAVLDDNSGLRGAVKSEWRGGARQKFDTESSSMYESYISAKELLQLVISDTHENWNSAEEMELVREENRRNYDEHLDSNEDDG